MPAELTNSLMLLAATFFFVFWLKRESAQRIVLLKTEINLLQESRDHLTAENQQFREENRSLEKEAGETITLFDITKEICKSLDQEALLASFRENLQRYLAVGDCRFIEGEADLGDLGDYAILPLKIDQQPVGYLVAQGIQKADQDKFYILAQQFILGIKRALLYRKVQELAITDSLTQILNRRYFLERFKEELRRAKKFKLKFSFLMVDVDNFKKCNDQYGHLVGDVVLKEVARTIKENIRQVDLFARFGGDEFSLILSETQKDEAEFIARRILGAIAAKNIRAYDEDLKISVSIGISMFPATAADLESLIDKADQALYRAKQSGKNMVCLYPS